MRHVHLLPVGVLIGLSLAAFSSAHAQVVITPNTAATTEGNTDNVYPFDIAAGTIPSMRYQQVYSSSLFSAISSPELITQITFRPEAISSFSFAFASTLPDIQINLSTTATADDALSTTFANNIGSNDTIVVPREPLSLSSAYTGPVGGPKVFDIIIPLTIPFLYNPSRGNLLLDVRNFGGGLTTSFDAVFTPGDGVSRVSSVNSVTDASGNGDTAGLVTQFTFRPASQSTPEPGSIALLAGLSVTGAGFLTHRRKYARKAV